MRRKLTITGDISYGNGDSSKSFRVLGEGCYTVGDINSINDCLEEAFRQAELTVCQVESAAKFFGFVNGESFRWECINVRFTEEDGSEFDEISYKDISQVKDSFDFVRAFTI